MGSSQSTTHLYAGRDINNFSVRSDESSFDEVDFRQRERSYWIVSDKIQEIADNLKKNRLVLLSGNGLFDKDFAAQCIACLLWSQDTDLCTRIWRPRQNVTRLQTALKDGSPTLLLLHQIGPEALGQTAENWRLNLEFCKSYSIITTDSCSAWQNNSGAIERFDESWDTFYGRETLAFLLKIELGVAFPKGASRPDCLRLGSIFDNKSDLLAPEVPLTRVIDQLKTPARVRQFVRWLSRQDPKLDPKQITDYLSRIEIHRELIDFSYRALSSEDQFLCLGLSFFDGLPLSQALAGLESISDTSWRDRGKHCFDLIDLERVAAYFGPSEVRPGEYRAAAHSPEFREEILRTAAHHHPRRLSSAVPQLLALLVQATEWAGLGKATAPQPEESSNGDASDKASPPKAGESSEQLLWKLQTGLAADLFGSRRAALDLQEALVRALSSIGLLSLGALESHLLNVAVHSGPVAQQAVAMALAGWRSRNDPKASEKLLEVLKDWWRCGQTHWLKLLGRTAAIDVSAATRATVTFAVGHAARFDPPGHLDPGLLDLVQKAITDSAVPVRQSLISFTLPMVMAWHLNQADPRLTTLILDHEDLIEPAAWGAALSCSLQGKPSIQIVERWLSEGLADEGFSALLKNPTRKRRLELAILTYGYMNDVATLHADGTASHAAIIQKMAAILKSTKSKRLRNAAIRTACRHITWKREGSLTEFHSLLQLINPDEQKDLARIIADLHFEEEADRKERMIAGSLGKGNTSFGSGPRQRLPKWRSGQKNGSQEFLSPHQ